MAKKKKKLPRVNCDGHPLLDAKPPKDQRPKCLNCDQTILLRSSFWYWGEPVNIDADGRKKPRYYYDGISYFCSRNCSHSYAHKAAEKALKVEPFNKVK